MFLVVSCLKPLQEIQTLITVLNYNPHTHPPPQKRTPPRALQYVRKFIHWDLDLFRIASTMPLILATSFLTGLADTPRINQ